MYIREILLIVLSTGIISKSYSSQNIISTKPNIIYILADDLGYGDLSCYGQKKFETPNIDKMAREGMLFTQHYSGSTVCAPSRSALMTGQHTGHTYIRANKEIEPEGQQPLSASVVTLAEVLKKAGYTTGAFGKWGLGMADTEGSPNKQGFDKFFGYLCQRYAHRYYPEYLWDNNKKYQLEGNNWKDKETYAPDVIQTKTLDFIKENKDKPFFAYIPIVLPHAELIVPDDSLTKILIDMFEDEPWGFNNNSNNPYIGNAYGSFNFMIEGYAPVAHPRATFAAMVKRLDRYVGEILNLLKILNIHENTIVIFTSDNGPHQEGGADPDFFNSNASLRGYKRDLYEGGIRVPMITWWPETISCGSKTNHISAFWDVMPTLAEITSAKIPEDIDGVSFLPTLLGKDQAKHDFLYWEFHELGGRQALRKGNWKLVRYSVLNPDKITTELYNINTDPRERINMAEKKPELVKELTELMKNVRTESDSFNFEPNP